MTHWIHQVEDFSLPCKTVFRMIPGNVSHADASEVNLRRLRGVPPRRNEPRRAARRANASRNERIRHIPGIPGKSGCVSLCIPLFDVLMKC